MTEGVHARNRGGRETEKRGDEGHGVDHWEKEIQRAEEEAEFHAYLFPSCSFSASPRCHILTSFRFTK